MAVTRIRIGKWPHLSAPDRLKWRPRIEFRGDETSVAGLHKRGIAWPCDVPCKLCGAHVHSALSVFGIVRRIYSRRPKRQERLAYSLPGSCVVCEFKNVLLFCIKTHTHFHVAVSTHSSGDLSDFDTRIRLPVPPESPFKETSRATGAVELLQPPSLSSDRRQRGFSRQTKGAAAGKQVQV